jgi:hypothetical protein
MAAIDEERFAQPYIGTADDMYDFLQGLMYPTATTAELAAIADPINTLRKRVGKLVFDVTLGQPVWADAATAAGTWSLSTGIVAHTPS